MTFWKIVSFGIILNYISGCSTNDSNEIGVMFHAIGSVDDVIHGKKPSSKRISMKEYVAAFEAGSPNTVFDIGEFIGFNGVAYTQSTGDGPNKNKLIYGSDVVSNGAIFLPKDKLSTTEMEINETISLNDLYIQIYEKYQKPICFIGTTIFELFHATSISHSPIYNENIFENREKYYSNPDINSKNISAAVMGCLGRLDNVEPVLKEGLTSVLYDNPNEVQSKLKTHLHALETNKFFNDISEISPDEAKSVRHVFSDSIINKGKFTIFIVDSIKRLD